MAAQLRALAVVASLFVCGVDCAPAGAQTHPAKSPQADSEDQGEEPETDPPTPVVAAPAPSPQPKLAPATETAPAPVVHVSSGPKPARLAKTRYAGPIATLPGFEMRPDGGSRLFVEISQPVGVEERRTQRTLTYVLKGARVIHRNNENALVTVHFNTPVTRARLLPSGRDLLFTIELRANAAASWKMQNESDGTSTLQIDFAKGDFLPRGDAEEVPYALEAPLDPGTPAPGPPSAAPSTPSPSHGKGHAFAHGRSGSASANPPFVGD